MRDVDLSQHFPLERLLRRLSPRAASVLLTSFVLSVWALGAVIDSI